jgi:uncharacterized Fe-S center protein
MKSKVYFTREISPAALVRIYEKLSRESGVKMGARPAVKISSGEPGGNYYLHSDFITPLVERVGGRLVECNTAYHGKRDKTADHEKAIANHGFADMDIMDRDGETVLPVAGGLRLKENLVGSHLLNYDSMLVLSHFKGHPMAGFGGALKNVAIGCASRNGKLTIHSGGRKPNDFHAWVRPDQSGFLEAMADADKSVFDYFAREHKPILFINVANNLSVDCDCVGGKGPAAPEMKDLGIFASTDPVALDQSCVTAVKNADNPGKKALLARIAERNGEHHLEAAAALGLGSREYEIIDID